MDLQERLKHIRLVVMDVDGTLTDGGMYYSKEGDAFKRFYVQDGMGITLMQKAGLIMAILTSEVNAIVPLRAEKLKIEHVILGCRAKKQALIDLSQKLEIPLEQIAYIGDDVNDEAPMKIAGIGVCPSDSVPVILKTADYICKRPGGQGAVREFAELLLEAQGKSNTLPDAW